MPAKPPTPQQKQQIVKEIWNSKIPPKIKRIPNLMPSVKPKPPQPKKPS